MKKDILISGNIYKSIVIYAIPIVIANGVQQLYNFCDMLIVGRILGLKALAACGGTEPIFFFVFGFFFALTQGFSIVTAQSFGRQNFDKVRRSFAISSVLSVITALLVTGCVLPLSYQILRFLNTPHDILELAHSYMFIMILGTLPLILFNLFACTMRALGDSRTPLYFLIISSLINLSLDLILILVFKLGIEGASWATVIAWTISDILCYIHIQRHFPELRLCRSDFRFNFAEVFEHLKIGIPMGVQINLISVCVLVVQNGINRLGTDAVAAFASANIVDHIFSQIYISLGAAIAVFAAQNYGAGNYTRIRSAVKASALINLMITVVIAISIMLFSKILLRIFITGGNAHIIALAQDTLYLFVIFYFMFGLIMTFKNILQGLGLTKYPLISSVLELLLRVMVVDYMLINFGYLGVCSIMPMGWMLGVAIMAYAYFYESRKFLCSRAEA